MDPATRAELLAVPKIACLGFHASLLPRYRGRAPINWALIHGERETGNTMMVLEPGADEGDIVAQRRIEITDDDDCRTLYEKVGATEVSMLAEILPQLRGGVLPRRKQDSTLATVDAEAARRRRRHRLEPVLAASLRLGARAHPSVSGSILSPRRRRLSIWKAEPSQGPFPTRHVPPGAIAFDTAAGRSSQPVTAGFAC